MDDRNLLLRMGVTSSIIFGFYLLLVKLALDIGLGLPVILAGLVLFVGFQYVMGTWGVLRQIDAQELPREDFAAFYEEYESACEEMGFADPPRLMVTKMGTPNAFAVGRKGKGTIVVSVELLELLDFDEAAGVVAHELAHLKNRDSVVMVIGESISSIVGLLIFLPLAATDSLVLSIIGWILSSIAKFLVMLFVLALSRYREFVADRDAAAAMGTGDPLARALQKIDTAQTDSEVAASVSALCISKPDTGILATIVSTHPSTEKRIERLRNL